MREKEEGKMISMFPAWANESVLIWHSKKGKIKEEKTWNKLEQRRDEKVALDSIESGVPLGI